MQLTMTGEYAIQAMIHLAEAAPLGTAVSIAAIAAGGEIPDNFLRKIITQLTKAGLITSKRGAGGGIQLARQAERITLLEVIEAVEGKIFLNKCLMHDQVCSRSSWCAVHIVWCEAQQALAERLARQSLSEIASVNTRRRERLRKKPAHA